jgi:HEPN/RES N-terminal domain 1
MADAEVRVCHGCFGDAFLKREVRRNGKREECAYCGKTRLSLSLEEVANLFEYAISTHYERTPSEPTLFEQATRHGGFTGIWLRDGQPVLDLIQEIGETTEDIAEDIRDLLQSRHSTREDFEMGYETEFHSDSQYESSAVAGGELDAEWPMFEHSLKTESRYFSPHCHANA